MLCIFFLFFFCHIKRINFRLCSFYDHFLISILILHILQSIWLADHKSSLLYSEALLILWGKELGPKYRSTGWSNWTEISFDLITPARRHPMKWDICPFSLDIQTFSYMVSKNANKFHMIFIDWCVGGLSFWIFVKIHWKLRIK